MHKDPGLVSAEALIDQGSAETRVKCWIHLDGVREPSLKSGFRSLSRQFYTLFHLTKRLRSGPCRCLRQLVKESPDRVQGVYHRKYFCSCKFSYSFFTYDFSFCEYKIVLLEKKKSK